MKKFLALAYILSVTSLSAQIASMEAYVIQDGKDSDYRKIEEFVAPLKAMAIKEGNLMQWIVMKRKSGGDLRSIDKTKEIANYIVFNIYKDKSQMDSDNWNNYRGYASKVYKRKMSKSSINKMFNMAEGNQVKKSWRQYVIQGIYQTPSYRPQVGDVINTEYLKNILYSDNGYPFQEGSQVMVNVIRNQKQVSLPYNVKYGEQKYVDLLRIVKSPTESQKYYYEIWSAF